MKKIYFLRSAPYKYAIKGEDLYDSFNEVAKKTHNPKLSSYAKNYLLTHVPDDAVVNSLVFYSPNFRSKHTAKLISPNIKKLPSLLEIGYQMEDFISKEEFFKDNTPNVKLARMLFVNALVTNRLQEKYNSVLERIRDALDRCSKTQQTKIVVISHGFFLKVIEAFIRDPKIVRDPSRLIHYFDGTAETFKFCEGFVVEYDGKKFVFKLYIRNKKSNCI